VPMGRTQSLRGLRALLRSPEARDGGYARLVAFRPTGWAHKGMKAKPRGRGSGGGCGAPVRLERDWDNGKIKVYGVAYSEHSSFQELCDCVMDCYPLLMVPTVQASKAKEHLALVQKGMRDAEPKSWEVGVG